MGRGHRPVVGLLVAADWRSTDSGSIERRQGEKKMQIGGRKDEEMSGELGWWCWGEHKEEKKNGRKE